MSPRTYSSITPEFARATSELLFTVLTVLSDSHLLISFPSSSNPHSRTKWFPIIMSSTSSHCSPLSAFTSHRRQSKFIYSPSTHRPLSSNLHTILQAHLPQIGVIVPLQLLVSIPVQGHILSILQAIATTTLMILTLTLTPRTIFPRTPSSSLLM